MVYVQSHKDLVVWQKSISLVKEVYLATGHMPKDERFGLVSQMKRSSVSIPSNIAEGYIAELEHKLLFLASCITR
ncbi:hypothetical protein COT83_00350 [Candidatus Peregrinibacteria bacterium CG10_big_fil_rev_8_21_14_0_10_44_7]|nr:MAG: hypothetical protein COT83_00350 [Candidatus Peregrinibacteria bacterium CG10_big_fil_rev_8_21_14_0_10_44_7]PIX79980.1 MAG: hypothetical protein COZ35_02215 [Candidatus Peregrinibacteria bacterium CG_4_10_14_3_um_filter_44_21]